MRNQTTLTTFESLVRLRQKHRCGGDADIDSSLVRAKVTEDIHFLRDRIEHIKKTHIAHTNPFILKTYESMLESREMILASLNDNNELMASCPETLSERPSANY